MTFGSGSNGCLGHGNFNDVTQVRVHCSEENILILNEHSVGSLLDIPN